MCLQGADARERQPVGGGWVGRRAGGPREERRGWDGAWGEGGGAMSGGCCLRLPHDGWE